MTPQTVKQIITIHILPNISQTMKFGQLIECNVRNIFFEKSYIKCVFVLIVSPSGALQKYVKKKELSTCFEFIKSFFEKQKEIWNQSLSLIFCIIFEEKYLSCYIPLIDQNFLPGRLYFLKYSAICILQLLVCQSLVS